MRAYPRETQEMVFDAHERAFELKTRGVEDILIAIVNGFKGFPEAILPSSPSDGSNPHRHFLRHRTGGSLKHRPASLVSQTGPRSVGRWTWRWRGVHGDCHIAGLNRAAGTQSIRQIECHRHIGHASDTSTQWRSPSRPVRERSMARPGLRASSTLARRVLEQGLVSSARAEGLPAARAKGPIHRLWRQ